MPLRKQAAMLNPSDDFLASSRTGAAATVMASMTTESIMALICIFIGVDGGWLNLKVGGSAV